MTEPKQKASVPMRAPKPRKMLGLSVPAIRYPHEEIIKPEVPADQPASTSDRHTPTERRSPTEPRSDTEPRSEMVSTAVQIERGSAGERGSVGEQGSSTLQVEWVDGYLQLPNFIIDRLLPLLSQDEASIYLRLYRLAQIKENNEPRGWCIVGANKLSDTTKIKRTALFAALKGLEAKGLIRRDSQEVLRGKWSGRGSEGNRYRVFEPDVKGRPVGERRSADERRSESEPRSRGGHMKEYMKENHERAPVAAAPAPLDKFEIRKKAVQLLAIHHTEPNYSNATLCRDVRASLVMSGIEPD